MRTAQKTAVLHPWQKDTSGPEPSTAELRFRMGMSQWCKVSSGCSPNSSNVGLVEHNTFPPSEAGVSYIAMLMQCYGSWRRRPNYIACTTEVPSTQHCKSRRVVYQTTTLRSCEQAVETTATWITQPAVIVSPVNSKKNMVDGGNNDG